MGQEIEALRNKDGSLPAHAFPGGYPIFYLEPEEGILCPDCANMPALVEGIDKAAINWEDGSLVCDVCGKEIECAYCED